MAGGVGAGGSYGAWNLDPGTMGTAALVGALMAGRHKIDQRVARRVAEMLTSTDPNVLAKGVGMVAGNRSLLGKFRV